jgi:hypothetical protein
MARTQVGGSTTSLSVGTVTSGSPAAVTLTNGVLSFTIPPGATGATGAQGPAGSSTSGSTVGLPVFAGPNAVTGSPTDYILLNSSNQNGYWGAGSIVSTYAPPTVTVSSQTDTSFHKSQTHPFNLTTSVSITEAGGWTQSNGCNISTTVQFLKNRVLQNNLTYTFTNTLTDTRTLNLGTDADWIIWVVRATTTLTTPQNENFVTTLNTAAGAAIAGVDL